MASFVLLLMGIGCLVIKSLSVEYIDAQGVLHENFFLLPIGFLFIFSSLMTFIGVGFNNLRVKYQMK